jgi:hypothetical protein
VEEVSFEDEAVARTSAFEVRGFGVAPISSIFANGTGDGLAAVPGIELAVFSFGFSQ